MIALVLPKVPSGLGPGKGFYGLYLLRIAVITALFASVTQAALEPNDHFGFSTLLKPRKSFPRKFESLAIHDVGSISQKKT